MARDSQRSKVYAAENAAQRTAGIPGFALDPAYRDLDACRRFIIEVCSRKRVQNHYPRAVRIADGHFRLRPGTGNRRATCLPGFNPVITLPLWSRNEAVMLHELAHALCDPAVHHGWQFAECEIWLWRQHFGVAASETLERAFKSGKVKYRKPRPKRQMTDAERAVLVERLAAARAVRAANQRKAA